RRQRGLRHAGRGGARRRQALKGWRRRCDLLGLEILERLSHLSLQRSQLWLGNLVELLVGFGRLGQEGRAGWRLIEVDYGIQLVLAERGGVDVDDLRTHNIPPQL